MALKPKRTAPYRAQPSDGSIIFNKAVLKPEIAKFELCAAGRRERPF